MSPTDVPIESGKELFIMLATTFGLPIIFIVVDYVFRSQASQTAFEDLVLQSGPDCCILSFGAAGAVFMDASVQTVPGLNLPVVVLFIVAMLLIFRFLCLGAARKRAAKTSLILGLASIFTLLLVPTIAFVVKRLM